MNQPASRTSTQRSTWVARVLAPLPLTVLLLVSAVVADFIASDASLLPALAAIAWLAHELYAHHRLVRADDDEPSTALTAPGALADRG